MEAECIKFLQTGDSDIFLVALAEHIPTAAEDVASTLLLDQHEPILMRLGWDVLSLFTPHLHPSQHHCWDLINKIAAVCPAKEMSLALLEQMELLSSSGNVQALLMMLEPLQKVLLQLTMGRAVDSGLQSVGRLLQRHYVTLNQPDGKQNKKAKEGDWSSQASDSDDEGGDGSKRSGGQIKGLQDHKSELLLESDHSGPVEKSEDVGNTEERTFHSEEDVTEELTVHKAVGLMLNFLLPFVEQIHTQHMEEKVCIKQNFWSERQKGIISILVRLLDQPLVSTNLDMKSKKVDTNVREMAATIMLFVTKCHCGCVRLLSWNEQPLLKQRTVDIDEDEEEEQFSLSTVGLACYAYLLFSEGMEESYYPTVMSPAFTFQLNLRHVLILLETSQKNIITKGLALLSSLLSRLSLHSLSSHTLDNKTYLKLSEHLTHLMTTCPHRSVRRQCVPLLLKMISCFSESGRHRLYLSLLHSVSHAGVKGLLLHNIKNEVDQALTKGPQADSHFFGPRLVQLLDLTLCISEEEELLKEMDRIMPALNFLRYLLIRDKPDTNTTGIWTIIDRLLDRFLTPLRDLLLKTRAQCQGQLKVKREESRLGHQERGGSGDKQGETEMTVEVMGQSLPQVTLEDEIRMLHGAQSHMDMLESILVRVEELAEQRT